MGTNLAQRAQAKTNTPARQNGGGATLSDQIRSMESQFALAMPKGAEAAQLVRDALTAVRQTPKLAECDPASVLGSLMTCAQLGLRPGVLGHAYLLPFWDGRSRSNRAQLVIGYQGLIELAHRSGKIKSLIARTVHENDEFQVDYGLDDNLIHRPCMRGDKGNPIGYYAVAKFTTGGHAFFVMSHDEMLAYRQAHAKARTREGKIVGPWADHFEGMAHKTVVRQLSKWMPKSTEMAVAIEADDRVRVDLTPTADPATASEYIDGDAVDGEIVEETAAAKPATAAKIKKIAAECDRVGVPEAGRVDYCVEVIGRRPERLEDLTADEADKMLAELATYGDAAEEG